MITSSPPHSHQVHYIYKKHSLSRPHEVCMGILTPIGFLQPERCHLIPATAPCQSTSARPWGSKGSLAPCACRCLQRGPCPAPAIGGCPVRPCHGHMTYMSALSPHHSLWGAAVLEGTKAWGRIDHGVGHLRFLLTIRFHTLRAGASDHLGIYSNCMELLSNSFSVA